MIRTCRGSQPLPNYFGTALYPHPARESCEPMSGYTSSRLALAETPAERGQKVVSLWQRLHRLGKPQLLLLPRRPAE